MSHEMSEVGAALYTGFELVRVMQVEVNGYKFTDIEREGSQLRLTVVGRRDPSEELIAEVMFMSPSHARICVNDKTWVSVLQTEDPFKIAKTLLRQIPRFVRYD